MRALIVFVVVIAMPLLSADEPLTLARSIELPRVDGRIDHLAFDATGQHLFVAALGNNTVEVLDLKAGTHVKSLRLFVPDLNRLFLAVPHRGSERAEIRVYDVH
jgi:hypothetical protein